MCIVSKWDPTLMRPSNCNEKIECGEYLANLSHNDVQSIWLFLKAKELELSWKGCVSWTPPKLLSPNEVGLGLKTHRCSVSSQKGKTPDHGWNLFIAVAVCEVNTTQAVVPWWDSIGVKDASRQRQLTKKERLRIIVGMCSLQLYQTLPKLLSPNGAGSGLKTHPGSIGSQKMNVSGSWLECVHCSCS